MKTKQIKEDDTAASVTRKPETISASRCISSDCNATNICIWKNTTPISGLKFPQQQVEATRTKRNTIDHEKIAAFLETLSYPLYFLGFETFNSAIPLYDGVKPYQHLPFQYSLHYQKKKGGKVYHTEFLAQPGSDPRKPLLEKLLKQQFPDKRIISNN